MQTTTTAASLSEQLVERMFYLSWIGLLSLPVISLGTSVVLRRFRPRVQSLIARLAAGILFASAVLHFLGVGFVSGAATIAWVLAAYSAYCFLVPSCLRIVNRSLRAVVLLVASVPICIGYLMSTIGIFALVLIAIEITDPPAQTQSMPNGLICTVSYLGLAGSEIDAVRIYRYWSGLPFVRRQVASATFDPNAAKSEEVSCQDLFRSYTK